VNVLRTFGAPLLGLVTVVAVIVVALLVTSNDGVSPDYRSPFSLRRGECFTRGHLDSQLWATVEVVPCDSDRWLFGYLSSFRINLDGDYPAEDFFWDEAWRRCESGWTTILFPSKESWDLGDRGVRCLFEPGSVPPSL